MSAPSSSRPVARLTTAAQMVASLPVWLGFVPTESLVVVCCHEPRGRLGLTMRVDLPPPQHERALVADLVRRVRQEQATRVLIAVYTDAPDGRSRVRTELVDGLREQLADLVVTEAVLVRDSRFFSYLCADPRCCPPEGTPVDAAAQDAALLLLKAETVLEGRPMMKDRAALEASLAGPVFLAAEAAAQGCEAAVELLAQQVAAEGRGLAVLRAIGSWTDVIEQWSSPPAHLTDEQAAALAVSLIDTTVRDLLAVCEEEDVPALLRVLEELCRRTPEPYDAPVCSLFGYLSYCRGGGAVVSIAIERALRSDPQYALALLLDEALDKQLPPAQLRALTQSRPALDR